MLRHSCRRPIGRERDGVRRRFSFAAHCLRGQECPRSVNENGSAVRGSDAAAAMGSR